MSSNRVCYSNGKIITDAIGSVCDKFTSVIKEQAKDSNIDLDTDQLTENFKKNFERMMRLNLQYVGSENSQSAAENNTGNERLEYFSTQVYPLMNSLVLELTEKRKRYPQEIKNCLKEKCLIEKESLKKLVSSVECDIQDEKNEDLVDLESIKVDAVNKFCVFNEVAESLKDNMNNYIEANKCVSNLKNTIDNIDHL